jgi:hypothetical protein
MAPSAFTGSEINTEITQAAPGWRSRRPAAGAAKRGPRRVQARVAGDSRESVRDPARLVVEMDHEITVYPPEAEGEPWRAVFTGNGQRRYRQATTEDKLVAKLAKVTERLAADAPNMECPGPNSDVSSLGTSVAHPRLRRVALSLWSEPETNTMTLTCGYVRRYMAPIA